MSSLRILNVRIDDVTLDEACARAAALIEGGGAHQFATVNPEFVMTAQRDPDFRAILENAALNLPDGVGVTLAARWRGRPLRERVTGVALAQSLCALAARRGWRVFLLGAAPGVAERAADVLLARNAGLIIAGTFAGSSSPEGDAESMVRIGAARPQVLLVAYGAPAQEFWLARNLGRVLNADPAKPPGLVGMGVGGTFDYLAGVQRLAPAWVRRVGFEWLFRLVRQPSRWRRQLDLARFALCVLTARQKDQR